uniref:Putative site-specific tyrosine recombinase n=1 Tax=viral metagenome TaxID=1070528 RepID=A0A6M3L4H1_9ZZZZ
MKTKIQEYLKSPDVTSLAKSTQELYKNALRYLGRYLESNSGMHKDEVIDKDFFDRFTLYLSTTRNLSGKSIQQYLTCIKIFLKWNGTPVEYTYKITNKERKQNKRKHMDRWFTELDISKCLAYEFSNNGKSLRNKIMVRLLIETGCRVRELSFVTGNDIDVEDGIIYLRDSKTEPRPAFFSPETGDLLRGLQASNLFNEDNVFPDVKAIKGIITKMLTDLGLKGEKDGRGGHTFRHFTASYLFYSGDLRLQDIAFLLGDAPETIAKIYLHPTPLMLRERVVKGWGWDV